MRSFADFEAALAAQLAAYPGENSTEIKPFELNDLEEAVVGAEGLRAGGWDLAIFPTDWIGSAVESGALENLSLWMQSSPLPDWPEGWPPSLRDPLRQHDGFYCIPWHDGPECLIYRKDLFEDAAEGAAFQARYGRKLAPPATWEQFHETARFFTRPDAGLYGSLFAAYPDGHNTLYDLVLQVWSRGGELYDEDGQPTLTDAKVVQALDFYRTIVKDPQACYPNASRIDSIHSGDIFLSGQIAMMANWFGFAARASAVGSPLHGKIGLAPIPGGAPGETASLSVYWVIGIGSGSRQKQAGYDLLRHIASPAMDKLTALHGAVGVRLSTWNDPQILERTPVYGELRRLSASARTLPFCQSLLKLAEIINQVTVAALETNEPSKAILDRAQRLAVSDNLRLI